jgi:hypothetical protein
VAELDQINVSTLKYIKENPALVDNFFQQDPLLAYAKLNLREDWDGGALIQEGFYTGGLIGGPVGKGQEFDISEKQVEQAGQFTPKIEMVNVTLAKEDIQVFNRGPLAAFRLVDSRMTNAYMTLGANVAIGMYLDGVQAAYLKNINGLSELVSDGTTTSWNSVAYTTYGGLTRNAGQVGSTLNSSMTDLANTTIEYNTLEESYGNATYGNVEPNFGVTTVKGYSYIKEKFQTQQRFNDTQDPAIGFNGLKFNSATLIKSRYCPGSDIATANTTSNTAAVAMLKVMSGGSVTAYPTLKNSGSETLFWLNCRKPYFNFYVSTDAEFGFGFTGFKPAQGNLKVAGQCLAALNVTGSPRYHAIVYGFNG